MNIHTKPTTSEKGRVRKTDRTLIWSQEKMAEAAAMWAKGYTSTHIAKQFCISRSSFSGMASRNPSLFPKKKSNGIPKPKAGRWTQANIDECIRLRRSGKTAKFIAEKIGMAKAAVEHLIRKNRHMMTQDAAPEPANHHAVPSLRRSFIAGQWVDRVPYTTISGAVVSLPRVSILNGKEA